MEAYIFKGDRFRRDVLVEETDTEEGVLYLEFPFIDSKGTPFPLYLKVESRDEINEIKDVSVLNVLG